MQAYARVALAAANAAYAPLVLTNDTVTQVRALTLEVASKLLEVLVVQYPALREAVRAVARTVLDRAHEAAMDAIDDLLHKEKDPFTVNDFLEQHINKLRCADNCDWSL
jgi:hypothetical protein